MLKVRTKTRQLPILTAIQTSTRRLIHLELRPHCVRPALGQPSRCENGS